jgi:hypothetical protein
VTNEVRLSRLGARLAGLLAPQDCAAFRCELESAGPDAAFDVLDRLAVRFSISVCHSGSSAGIRESRST